MFFDRFIPYFHLKCLLLMKVFHSLIKKKKRNLSFSRWEGINLTLKHRKCKFRTYMLNGSIIFYLKLNSVPSALRCASPPSHLSFLSYIHQPTLFPGDIVVKNLPANAGELGSIPGSGRSPGEGSGNPLQYSCMENPMDRGAWRAIVPGVAKSWTWLSDSTAVQRGLTPEIRHHLGSFLPSLPHPINGLIWACPSLWSSHDLSLLSITALSYSPGHPS